MKSIRDLIDKELVRMAIDKEAPMVNRIKAFLIFMHGPEIPEAMLADVTEATILYIPPERYASFKADRVPFVKPYEGLSVEMLMMAKGGEPPDHALIDEAAALAEASDDKPIIH